MKKYLFLSIFLIIGLLSITPKAYAAICGDSNTVGQCGSAGGCTSSTMICETHGGFYGCLPASAGQCGIAECTSIGSCGSGAGCPFSTQQCQLSNGQPKCITNTDACSGNPSAPGSTTNQCTN